MPPKSEIPHHWFSNFPALSRFNESDFRIWQQSFEDTLQLCPNLDAALVPALIRAKTTGPVRDALRVLRPGVAGCHDPLVGDDLMGHLKNLCLPHESAVKQKLLRDVMGWLPSPGATIKEMVAAVDGVVAKNAELGLALPADICAIVC